MSKIEREIKVLNIEVDQTIKKLQEIGAEDKGKKEQKIYVYDVPTLYYRFLEIRELINSFNQLLIETNLKKLEILLLEYIDLENDEELEKEKELFQLNDLMDILSLELNDIRKLLNNTVLENNFKKFLINPNKWIRLRKSNQKVELTTKHILNKKNNRYQNVIETEIVVSSFEETNNLLESIGIYKRNYQEKIRYSYSYKEAQIEIDIWPLLEAYLEIECDNENTINELLEKLDLKDNEIVSENTESLYKRKNIDILKISSLKF